MPPADWRMTIAALGVVGMALLNVQDRYEDAQRDDRIASVESDFAGQRAVQDRLGRLTHSDSGMTYDALRGEGLAGPAELEGYGRYVPHEQTRLLQQSVIQLVKRPPGTAEWQPWCTGNKVEIDDESYISFAAHCVGSINGIKGAGPAVVDVADVVPYEFGFQLLGADGRRDGRTLLADGVSVDYGRRDWALLRPAPAAAVDDGYAAVQALPYRELLAAPQPLAGEEARMAGLPSASANTLVEGVGIYLGRGMNEQGKELDYVGLRGATAPETNACNFGASGSAAVTASGRLTGPLAALNVLGYPDGTTPLPPAERDMYLRERLDIEAIVGVDTSAFGIVCGYTPAESPAVDDMLAGFNVNAADLGITVTVNK